MGFFSNLLSGSAGTLVESVGNAIDKVVTSDEERLELENEQARAQMEHKAAMRGLDVKETELFLADKDSARDSQARIQEDPDTSWLAKNIQPILALLVVAATFVMFAKVLYGEPPAKEDSNLMMMILGALISLDTQIVSYFFGSSRGGDEKARQDSALLIKR